jgi:hypothetical protein
MSTKEHGARFEWLFGAPNTLARAIARNLRLNKREGNS